MSRGASREDALLSATRCIRRDIRLVPDIIASAGPLLQRYDVVFCDVWGVIHDGHTAYATAGEALARFRAGGGTVILVSNAPFPGDRVATVIDG